MNLGLTDDLRVIRENILKLCTRFGDDYWLARDHDGVYPEEFKQALAEGGWTGLTLPVEFGGSGLGITEGAVMMQAIAESGAGMSGASAIHSNIFAPKMIVKFGTQEQKERMLPGIIRGEVISAFAVTEPDAGLDTTNIKTKATLNGSHYLVNGRKVWTTLAKRATKLFLLARTTSREHCNRPTDGITLFYTDLDRTKCEAREIEKMGRKCIDSNQFFIDNLEIPLQDRIGEEGRGFEYILAGLNPERILLGAEAIGLGRVALNKATQYAKDRVVFNRPIGMNQSIQHPLARNWMELEAANLMMLQAARLYDAGQPCGAEANAAKFLGAEAGFEACTQSIMTHGGYGYAKEFHVERYLREVMIPRIAPVSREMILCFIAEKVLGLPKSY